MGWARGTRQRHGLGLLEILACGSKLLLLVPYWDGARTRQRYGRAHDVGGLDSEVYLPRSLSFSSRCSPAPTTRHWSRIRRYVYWKTAYGFTAVCSLQSLQESSHAISRTLAACHVPRLVLVDYQSRSVQGASSTSFQWEVPEPTLRTLHVSTFRQGSSIFQMQAICSSRAPPRPTQLWLLHATSAKPIMFTISKVGARKSRYLMIIRIPRSAYALSISILGQRRRSFTHLLTYSILFNVYTIRQE